MLQLAFSNIIQNLNIQTNEANSIQNNSFNNIIFNYYNPEGKVSKLTQTEFELD